MQLTFLGQRDEADLSPGWATSAPLMIRLPVRLSDQIFLIHGEPSTCAILAGAIRQKLNWHASIPVQSASVEI
jgi:hypothetical protein